jgi:hypothetical protein
VRIMSDKQGYPWLVINTLHVYLRSHHFPILTFLNLTHSFLLFIHPISLLDMSYYPTETYKLLFYSLSYESILVKIQRRG